MDKKEAYKVVYDDLMKSTLFSGNFDATNGSKEFMFGVCAVMQEVAYGCNEIDNFDDIFGTNYFESVKRAKGQTDPPLRRRNSQTIPQIFKLDIMLLIAYNIVTR